MSSNNLQLKILDTLKVMSEFKKWKLWGKRIGNHTIQGRKRNKYGNF